MQVFHLFGAWMVVVLDENSDEWEIALVTDDTSSQSFTHHYGIDPQGQLVHRNSCTDTYKDCSVFA